MIVWRVRQKIIRSVLCGALAYCVQQLCTVQCTHTHINRPSCLLVRFIFYVVVLFVTVYLCQIKLFRIITARRSYASAVLGVVILSVCLSVRLSHACFVTNPKNLPAIFLYHMKGQSFQFSATQSGWWATSLSPKMGDRSDPPPSKIAHVDRFPPVTSQQ